MTELASLATPEKVKSDVIAALVDQGFKRAQAAWAVAGKTGTFAAVFAAALNDLKNSHANGRIHQPRSPQTIHMSKTKTCKGYGQSCDAQLSPGNTTGLCTRCYARKNYHDNKNGRTAKEKTTKVVTPQNDQAVLRVNEEQLNRFLVGLPMEAKQQLAQHWLSGGN